MSTAPRCYGIIPSRYASTRFPGKPLADIHGKPMFWHVWHRALQCSDLRSVTLATDDERIADAAKKLGVPFVMTGMHHSSGTDRVCEAAMSLGLPDDAVVVNIQGDEPALDPAMLGTLTATFVDAHVRVATLARPLPAEEAQSPDRVKVVRALSGDALYFSRSPIPYGRDGADPDYLVHVGIYAFRLDALQRFTELPPGRLEGKEKLEQLRFLENGIPIRVQVTNKNSLSVDTPEDLEVVRRVMRP